MTDRFKVLDGWRALSILFVLAAHLFPLGPKAWQLNEAIAGCGLALFFILSGFLITNILIKDQNIKHFLIRRFLRIIPLAWLFIIVTLLATSAKHNTYIPHFLFYANWPPMTLTEPTGHLWSLCVEMQFYLLIALLVAVLKKRAFILLPLICVAVTANRYINDAPMLINTYYRVDEILAGCILALIYHQPTNTIKNLVAKINPLFIFLLLLLSAHRDGGLFTYARPYFAMLLIGSTLFSQDVTWFNNWLKGRILFYIASISFALYVIHGGLMNTWLAEGDKLEKYLKRPLLLAATFALAHLSTFYYEKYWINLGKKLTKKSS